MVVADLEPPDDLGPNTFESRLRVGHGMILKLPMVSLGRSRC